MKADTQQVAGHATAWGAVSILNATATGIGCSLAIDAVTTAHWDSEPASQQVGDNRLVDAVLRHMAGVAGWRQDLFAHVSCPLPPSRGLKTSSSTAAALLQAAHRAIGRDLLRSELERVAVDVSLEAGVSLTGAFDDQVATVRGGAHLTDNHARTVLATLPIEPWHVAVWVPHHAITKTALRGRAATTIASDIHAAQRVVESGDLPAAMTRNGTAFTRLYRSHGLAVDDRPAQVALRAGARGAGLSGTGPAVAALFDQPTTLPAIPGGKWRWFRTVGAT